MSARPWLLLTKVKRSRAWTLGVLDRLSPGGESAFPREGGSLERRPYDVKRELRRDRAPVLRHVIRCAQRERVQREGRVHAGDRWEEPPSRDEEVGDVVGAA